MESNVYYIGGSPCSFKTAIADKISSDFGFRTYNSDNHIERYLEIGAKKRNKTLKKMRKVSVLEQWFLDLDVQVANEVELYTYAGKVIRGDLKRFYKNKNIVVEGCPIIPSFIDRNKIDPSNYIVFIASKSFERSVFEQREYINRYLNLTKDPELAFENWLKRDELIASYYKEECEKYGYKYIEVSAKTSFDELYTQVIEHFGLDILDAQERAKALAEMEEKTKQSAEADDSLKLDEIEEMAKKVAEEIEKTALQKNRSKDKIIGQT